MRRRASADRDLLGGTLDLLILRVVRAGPAHGLQIAQSIESKSDDVLLVEQGSLYPALHRLPARRGVWAGVGGVGESSSATAESRLKKPRGRRASASETRAPNSKRSTT